MPFIINNIIKRIYDYNNHIIYSIALKHKFIEIDSFILINLKSKYRNYLK